MNIAIDEDLTVKDVNTLREYSGWDHDEQEWEECLKQNIINISARNVDGEVVSVGFLCGNQRHAELVDLVVSPEYRKHGIERNISRLIINYLLEHKIKYLGLTYDKNFPWLKDFYETEGFQLVNFAMWHKSSLE